MSSSKTFLCALLILFSAVAVANDEGGCAERARRARRGKATSLNSVIRTRSKKIVKRAYVRFDVLLSVMTGETLSPGPQGGELPIFELINFLADGSPFSASPYHNFDTPGQNYHVTEELPSEKYIRAARASARKQFPRLKLLDAPNQRSIRSQNGIDAFIEKASMTVFGRLVETVEMVYYKEKRRPKANKRPRK